MERFDAGAYKSKGVEADSGALSVATSQDIARLKATASPMEAPSAPREIKHVRGRTFYLSDGQWIDSEYNGQTIAMRIGFGSTAYFELLRILPKAAPFISLGEKVTFHYNGLWLRIDPNGQEKLYDTERQKLKKAAKK